ncbi:MAG: penicillin-binding transpeptidase domain-containing protein [Microgenomates group bacterium]
MRLALVLIFALFFSRAFFITGPLHSYYLTQAGENRVKTEVVPAPRGVMVDRDGRLVATNILVDGKTTRHYPDGEVVAAAVGYLSEGKGVAGLEKQYQIDLAGVDGQRVFSETAGGAEVEEVSLVAPEPGKKLALNLDLGLSTAAYQALKGKLAEVGKGGSAIVSAVNGEVLALVSLPSFDPNLFISGGKRGGEGGRYTDVASVVTDEIQKPLFNRAIGGSFPPGSVFKLVPALAGLASGVIDENDLIEDSGEIVVGPYRFGNWYFDKYGKTEGKINVKKALARSNDIFFYRLGEKLGVDRLTAYAKKLGLGEKTGIDLPGEASGLLPTPLWMEKEKGERWFLGNTYHLAIGQGDLLVTALQVNRMAAAVVSGLKCPPRLVGGQPSECTDLGLSQAAIETVREGMKMVCQEGGTGFPFFNLKGAVMCKTGTAQHGGEEAKPHAWMVVVIPRGDTPRWLVVTVMLDSAGEGSEQAGPVARQIVDYLLKE